MNNIDIQKGRALGIAIGLLMLGLLLAGGAGATTLTVCKSGCVYSTIQTAINAASVGDTIIVNSGKYYENVNVNKRLVLIGADSGLGKPIINASGIGSPITISVGMSTIDGFTVEKSQTYPHAGIRVISNYNVIINNNASGNYMGISLEPSTNNNTVTGNNIHNNYYGMAIELSKNNSIKNNNLLDNDLVGIAIITSNDNVLDRNYVSNSLYGISLGAPLDNYPVVSCDKNILSNNNVNNNTYYGIELIGAIYNSRLFNNNVSNNNYGIYLTYDNIGRPQNTIIYNNNLINNIYNAHSYHFGNQWDNGISGNYYSNYDTPAEGCFDTNIDGICDLQYTIPGGSSVDRYPLKTQYIEQLPIPSPSGGTLSRIWSADKSPAEPFIWNSLNFGEFYYNLDYDISTESMTLLGNYAATRTIPRNALLYNTSKTSVAFKAFEKEGITVDTASTYDVVGWQAEKWVAVKGVANKIAKLVIEMGKDDKKTLTPGETWDLGEGYELTINTIDAISTTRRVSFSFKKDGAVIDEGNVQGPAFVGDSRSMYIKKSTILGESDALLFTVYVSNIFPGATSDMVQFKYAWLIDEYTAKEIKATDQYGIFEVRTANSNAIMMDNENTISLAKNSEVSLIGNMKFVIADNNTLRFYPFVKHTPGIYETRGTVIQESTSSAPFWNAYNFAGLFYDLKTDRFTESLSLTNNVQTYAAGRTIPKNKLVYSTGKTPVNFKVFEKEGAKVDADTAFNVVHWQGEKWVAVNGVTNKIAKLVFEMGNEDKKTLTVGETWDLGAGYDIIINSVYASAYPRQTWIILRKDGASIDDFIGQAPEFEGDSRAIYFKKKTILGEPDALLFAVYIDSIFSGATTDIVQFKYAWLIDESSAKEIRTADRFGVFQVRTANSTTIMMDNEDIVNLPKKSEATLMGNLKFVIADNNTLRFYPKVDYVIEDPGIIPIPTSTAIPIPPPEPVIHETRGTVVQESTAGAPVWNAYEFGGFFYDLKYDRYTETLSLANNVQTYAATRTIPKNALIYTTGKIPVEFKAYEKEGITVDTASAYYIVGWQAEKWVAVKGVTKKIAKLAFEMGKEDKKTLTVGETWDIGAGYELTVNSINEIKIPKEVGFTLRKDGTVVDVGIGYSPINSTVSEKQKAVYFKTKTILNESNALLFTIYVDAIFSDMVQFKYGWLIDENTSKEIRPADMYGVFQVRTADSNAIMMDNENTISLAKNSEVSLMGNMKFIIADNNTLRFYPFVKHTTPGTYETRGTVVQESTSGAPVWNAHNFAGFYYDLKNDRFTETLSLANNVQTYAAARTIPRNNLLYGTRKIPTNFKVSDNEGLSVDADTSFNIINWHGEKWVTVHGVANKIAKLAFEMGKEDTKNLTTGETWALGAGYELTVNALDIKTTPRQVWFTLMKDGERIDEGIGQAPMNNSTAAKSRALYYKKKTIQGESDTLLFTIYINNITSNSVQFKYAWLMDESSAKEIRASDRYGVFEVRTANSDEIMMDNENTISLAKNSEPTLMGKMKFVIADSNTLRFYPKVDIVIALPGTTTVCSSGCDYTRIQDAINASSPGDTILVYNGAYYENVNVTKRLNLRGIGMPVVDAGGSGSVITLSEDGVTIEGFTATRGRSGIQVSSNNNTVKGNNANSNYRGGIDLASSSNNTVSGNNASNNSWGIGLLEFSNNNTLSGNNANSNTNYGIALGYSSNNMLTNNTMNSNKYNFILVGDCTSCYNNQIDTTNLVDGKPVYYIKGASDKIYDSSTNAGTFYCINCVNVTLKNIDIKNNGYGIFLFNTTRSTIQKVNISKNIYGIVLYLSSNNNIYQNNFINNTNQAYDNNNTNSWDSDYPSGGNYWSDYTGIDLNNGSGQNIQGSDDIGDTPYNIGGGGGALDRYPLMKTNLWSSPVIPFPNSLNTPTDPDGDGKYEDINGNGRADFNDVVMLFNYLEWITGNQPILNFDFNDNGWIDFNDIIKLFEEL